MSQDSLSIALCVQHRQTARAANHIIRCGSKRKTCQHNQWCKQAAMYAPYLPAGPAWTCTEETNVCIVSSPLSRHNRRTQSSSGCALQREEQLQEGTFTEQMLGKCLLCLVLHAIKTWHTPCRDTGGRLCSTKDGVQHLLAVPKQQFTKAPQLDNNQTANMRI